VKDLLLIHPRYLRGGRPWKDDRLALRGILFVLKTGIQWEELPADVFDVCSMTCWRQLRDWAQAGVWDALRQRLLEELSAQGRLDWSRAAIDSTSVAAKRGARSRALIPPTEARRAPSTTW
jgi:transposase